MSAQFPSPAATTEAVPADIDGDEWDIVAAAGAWNCRCMGDCSAIDAARCLYRATLELLSGRDEPALRGMELLRPLAAVVSRQKTRAGQAECLRFAHALADGDPEGALSACHRLIEIEREWLATASAPWPAQLRAPRKSA